MVREIGACGVHFDSGTLALRLYEHAKEPDRDRMTVDPNESTAVVVVRDPGVGDGQECLCRADAGQHILGAVDSSGATGTDTRRTYFRTVVSTGTCRDHACDGGSASDALLTRRAVESLSGQPFEFRLQESASHSNM